MTAPKQQHQIHSHDWTVEDPTIVHVCTLLGVKPDHGIVLDFMNMDAAGQLEGLSTTGAFASAWLAEKSARVATLMATPTKGGQRKSGWYWAGGDRDWEPALFEEGKGWSPAFSVSTAYFTDEQMGEIGPRITAPIRIPGDAK